MDKNYSFPPQFELAQISSRLLIKSTYCLNVLYSIVCLGLARVISSV